MFIIKILNSILLITVMFMVLLGFKAEPAAGAQRDEIDSFDRLEIKALKKTVSGQLSRFD